MLGERDLAGRQGRLLLAYLVVERSRPVSRDELAEALWERSTPASWESALRVLVSKLRKALAGHAELRSGAGGYRLELPAEAWVDVLAADQALRDAERLLGTNELEGAIEAATLAESLLREPFLAGENGSWAQTKRRELEQVHTRALDVLAEASIRSGEVAAAVRWAEQAVEAEPFRESGHRRLMEAHAASGNGAEALRAYERCRHMLAEELGAFPSPETEAVYRRLLEEPPAPPPAAPPRSASRVRRYRRRTALAAVALAAAAAAAAAAVIGFTLIDRGASASPVLPNSVLRVDPESLKVTEVASVGDDPDLIVVSGGFLWVTNYILRFSDSGAPRYAGDHTLTRIDPASGKTTVVGGGLAPCGITSDPSGDVWVANCYPPVAGLRDDIVRVDGQSLAFEKTWPAPGGDGFFRGLAYGDGSLWVSQIVGGDRTNANAITRIDPETGAAHTIHLARAGSELAWSGAYGELWIANFDDKSLTRLQPDTGATRTVDDVANAPAVPVVDGNLVWVGSWTSPQVVRIRAIGSPKLHRIDLPQSSAGVSSIAVGAGAVWATSPQEGSLWRINPRTGAVTRIDIPYSPTGVAADANDVWVTVRK